MNIVPEIETALPSLTAQGLLHVKRAVHCELIQYDDAESEDSEGRT